ncbi:FG-GAP repeat protein [Spirosoma litoris]
MMRTLYRLLTLLLLLPATVWAQIGISGPPNASAILDLSSPNNNKVFLPPRLTTAQRLAIASPPLGGLVYDLDKNTLFLYDGQNWFPLLPTSLSLLPTTSRTASDGVAPDRFGVSVAISGDYALVGAFQKTIGSNTNQGAAYVFMRSGSSWTQQQRLVASDGAANDNFGISVAISGDYAIVGASNKTIGSNSSQGAAYVFMRSGSSWTQQSRLVASDGELGDRFGVSVAISGDYALVGAYTKTLGSNSNQGAAYVFMRSGSSWTQQSRLVASDGVNPDHFGYSVAISGDYAIVGAYTKAIGSNTNQGAAYVFVRSGINWTQQQRLVASDGVPFDNFGVSVAISGDYAIVGASNKTLGSNTNQGAAYVFMRSGSSWTQQQRLVASDGAASDYFGTSVAISGDYALVGAPNKTIGSNSSQGAAYVFMRSGSSWPQQQRVTDNSPASTANGVSVGLSNGTYIIGGSGYQNFQGKVSFGTVN